MAAATRPTHTASVRAARQQSELRLTGVPLLLARVGCFIVCAYSLILFAPGLQTTYQQALTICASPDSCLPGQLTSGQAATLHSMGVSVAAYAFFQVAFTLLIALVWFVVALVIIIRASDNWMVLLIAAQAFTQGASGAYNNFLNGASMWAIPSQVLGALNSMLLFAFLAMFPSGQFAPRWLRWFLILALFVAALMSFVQLAFGFLYFFVVMSVLIGAQIYRYMRVSTPLQRQQTKWVILAIALVIVGEMGSVLPTFFIADLTRPDSLYFIIMDPMTNILIALCAVAFAFATLRYRLYDVDVIIRRTLVYGSLTLILAGVYVAGVVGVQNIVNTIARSTGGEAGPASPILIVVTTLLIAAIFQPLRHRIQRFIDRRFYRGKYDARKTLEAFSATLRQEVDLSALTGQLVVVVTETMHPQHVSLWLRDTHDTHGTPKERDQQR
ncbi:MAG TPA: hypothetical protein VFQ32_02225 [Ktedonobacterales bacterium]|nr:hypothetical protein [Ktedonobacterales bacterium]